MGARADAELSSEVSVNILELFHRFVAKRVGGKEVLCSREDLDEQADRSTTIRETK